MKVVKFHPGAETEMIKAAAHYEEQQPVGPEIEMTNRPFADTLVASGRNRS